MSYSRNGAASRAVALDLMLRTFMNSAEFHAPNPKIWENISKLVPGTTPQQCAQRWEELRMSHSSVAGDFSGLTATGRPISSQGRRQMSKFVRSMFNQHSHSLQHEPALTGTAYQQELRPHSVAASESQERARGKTERSNSGGTFVTNFCQTLITSNGGASDEKEDHKGDTQRESGGSSSDISTHEKGGSTHSVGENGPNMVIHVCDEAKKLKRNFTCPRDILIREMRYFDEYLSSSETQLWDDVDISVHCDVPVFEWLMKYAKRGMLEGPRGEKLSSPLEPPSLEPSNAISILISSEFLRMDTLVEECLVFCHDNISQVVLSPSNLGCINDKMLARLASKFTPLEVEGIVDKKDKIRSKLFIHQIQRLFDSHNSSPDCPANASTLYKCKHCSRLLTSEQQLLLPCAAKRLSVSRSGKVVYNHEPNQSWKISQYLQSMQQQEGLTPRDIYWRLWGIINTLHCSRCHSVFQCCDLPSCSYHPQNVVVSSSPASIASSSEASSPRLVYMCCKRPVNKFSTVFQSQDGCMFRDHITDDVSEVYSTLLRLRDVICADRLKANESSARDSKAAPLTQDCIELCLLQNEERKVPFLPTRNSPQELSRANSTESYAVQKSRSTTTHSNSISRQQSHAQYVARQQSHDYSDLPEDEDEAETCPPHLTVPTHQAKKTRNKHTAKHDSQGASVSQPVDWLWDSTKSKRLNQDMQRESDERRLAQLSSRLSQQADSTSSGSSNSTAAKEVTYPGGIFTRLEAQFRVQQAAKAMALQSNQLRSQGSGRKR